MPSDFSHRALQPPNRRCDQVITGDELKDVKQLRALSGTLPQDTIARFAYRDKDDEEHVAVGEVRTTERTVLAAGERLAKLQVPNTRGRFPEAFTWSFPGNISGTTSIELWFPAWDERHQQSPGVTLGAASPALSGDGTPGEAPRAQAPPVHALHSTAGSSASEPYSLGQLPSAASTLGSEASHAGVLLSDGSSGPAAPRTTPVAPAAASVLVFDARFRVVLDAAHKLGAGGFGAVYKGLDEATGAWIAAKVSHTALDANSASVADLEREVAALQRLTHDNIVRVFGFFRTPRPCLVLEWLPGGTAGDVAASMGGRLPLAVARRYLCGVLRALAYLHDHRVLHRDIKPANILVAADGSAKLSDFGLCKELAATASGNAGSAATGPLAGTALYLAPEVVSGKKANKAADMWALACTALQLLCGATPWAFDADFDASNAYAVLFRIGTSAATGQKPFSAAQLEAAGVPCEWVAVLFKGFAVPADARPSAAEMLALVEAL